MKTYIVIMEDRGVEKYREEFLSFNDTNAWSRGRNIARRENGVNGTWGFVVVNKENPEVTV